MKRRLTKLTAAGLAVLALTGCTGGVPEEVSEEPPVPKNVETTWTLVVGQPEGSTCWDAAESFAEALSDATEGAVAVEVQPRPLDRVTSLEQAAAGIVDLYLDSSFVYGSYGDEEELGRPFFSVTMPFLFPDAETAAEVLDSTGGEALNGVLAELGLRGLAYGELGFRYPTTSEGRAVTAPEDLEGLKIRTAGMLEVSVAYVDCWGAELYPSSFLDVMTPLSAGYYDGQESTLAEADAAGYQTVQTDVTIFPAFYEPAILTMNSDLYDSLSPDLREAVDRCGREAMADQRLRNREQEAEILERWQEEDGISVHVLTEEQWSAFQALTERLYDPEDPDHQDWFADCTPEWVELSANARRAACRLPAGLAEQMTSEALLETALDYPFNASMYVSSDLEGMFGKRAALAGNDALAELVTRPDAEEVIARALAAPAEAGEDPLRGVYLETFCAWLPELSRMAGV